MLALSSAPFAYAQKADSSARYVNPQNLPKPNGYSHAVEVSAGRTLYVSKLGDNSDGSSWSKAFTTVQAALK